MGTPQLTLGVWQARCLANSGSPDTWSTPKGKVFMFKQSTRVHEDHSLTGYILLKNETGEFERVGQFKIEGDGTTSLCPKFLRVSAETETTVAQPLPSTEEDMAVEEVDQLTADDEMELGSQY